MPFAFDPVGAANHPAQAPTFVALDFETTGFSPVRDRIVEVAAIRFDLGGHVLGHYHALVNPEMSCPEAARLIHGLSDAELGQAPPAAAVIPDLMTFLTAHEPTALVTHNASFDVGFLGNALGRLDYAVRIHPALPPPVQEWAPAAQLALAYAPRAGVGSELIGVSQDWRYLPAFDTKALARRHWPRLESYRLIHLTERFGLDGSNAHRALADADRCRLLFLMLRHGGRFRPLELLATGADDPPLVGAPATGN